MKSHTHTLAECRKAKIAVASLLKRSHLDAGVGIGKSTHGYFVKVLLQKPVELPESFPARVSGVPIVVELGGRIIPLIKFR